MERQMIAVERRAVFGKGAARRSRARGKVPGILYGHKEDPTPFLVDPAELRKRIRASGLGRNTIFQVEGLGREVLALLKETQIDPVRRDLLHVDLIEVRESDKVIVEVPIDFVGKPEGVVLGGELEIVRRTIAVRCSPIDIPKSIEADVTPLLIGNTLHVSDVPLPAGAERVSDGRFAVASVKAPKAEEVVAAPGAEVVVPDGGEAPAAAAAAPAAPAAPEKKGSEKKGSEKKGSEKKGSEKKGSEKKS